MTKYLLNLVCIIGIAGASHAQVANLEITDDGQAYLVFTNPQGNLAGYQIEDPTGVPVTFLRGVAGIGTGEFASVWASLDSQGATAGEPEPGTHDWFFDGDPVPTNFLGEGNIDGYLTRAPGAPVYIGQILDNGGVPFIQSDFDNIEFGAVDDPGNAVTAGTVTLRTRGALATGTTPLAGTPWSETGAIGAAGTDLDATFVENADGTGDKVVIDLKATTNDGTTTDFAGHVIVNGKVLAVTFADLADAGATRQLRVQAKDGAATIAIDADLTETGSDGLGRFGTLGSSMAVATVAGDFDLDDDSDDADIDAISAEIRDVAAGARSLLYDVGGAAGAVDAADRTEVITVLVERTGGNGTAVGDINLDGAVTSGDYTLWADGFGPGTGWGTGDLNGDGDTTSGDYTLWADGFGTGPNDAPGAPVAAPEPATMALLAMGALALVKRRRRA